MCNSQHNFLLELRLYNYIYILCTGHNIIIRGIRSSSTQLLQHVQYPTIIANYSDAVLHFRNNPGRGLMHRILAIYLLN